uniref:Uncharacterized protein n=1 Tax=Lepeophtheirus salmonis TaxID=72036 RepID=A0A0K2VL23_LEPSM
MEDWNGEYVCPCQIIRIVDFIKYMIIHYGIRYIDRPRIFRICIC